jgi:hypothetical protein
MKIFKCGLSVLLLFLFAGCSNSAMTMDKKERLFIANDETVIEVKTALFEKESINLGPLYIDQYIVGANEENCVVYEDIRSANGYRFNYAYQRSIDLIFNAYAVKEQKSYGNLTFYRLTLRDRNRSQLNLLALTSSKKSLKLLYGLDDEEVAMLQKRLEQNNTAVTLGLSAATQKSAHCIKNRWQPKLLIIDTLVGREGGAFPRKRKK